MFNVKLQTGLAYSSKKPLLGLLASLGTTLSLHPFSVKLQGPATTAQAPVLIPSLAKLRSHLSLSSHQSPYLFSALSLLLCSCFRCPFPVLVTSRFLDSPFTGFHCPACCLSVARRFCVSIYCPEDLFIVGFPQISECITFLSPFKVGMETSNI